MIFSNQAQGRVSACVLVLCLMHPRSALSERSYLQCEAAPPKVEMHEAIRLTQANLRQSHRGLAFSFESAVLMCRDKKKIWEIQARPHPYSSTKFVLHVHMDGSVVNVGFVTDG